MVFWTVHIGVYTRYNLLSLAILTLYITTYLISGSRFSFTYNKKLQYYIYLEAREIFSLFIVGFGF